MPVPWHDVEEESEAKRPRVSNESIHYRESRRSIQSAGGISWASSDLALAAKLLETPNARFPTITFSNIEEKRRVFTLVYDVLRYKSVLNRALKDVHFFIRYPYLKERCHLVWLLFLDLYKRDFTLRDPLDQEVEEAFKKQGLFEIDEILWQLRVKLAATVSRLRIKSGAHSLCSLLPKHLQIMRSSLEDNIITGWVNSFKTSTKEICSLLEHIGIKPLHRDKEILEPMTYKTDHVLPRFLHIMPNTREELVESPLVLDNNIIMQERTFCLGPAIMAQLLRDYSLSGKVAQTHVNSPITMAYFANLLINNDKIESLLVFGAGYRKEACEQYLRELGVKNTMVFAESFANLSPENRVLDNVIAVMATPPNSNSSVVDPVDLAVARGGDLQILQQLTDDDFASVPSGENINNFLQDQRDTLRRAMSKPQIQFVVYETHSRFNCENEEMAMNLVNELNNYAREVHLEELRRAQGEGQEKEKTQSDTSESQQDVPTIKVEEELNLPLPTPTQNIVIPPSDLFELADLPDLCPHLESCVDLTSEGTYISVIKRKEITRLDPKYMIQMAEARGLFGRPDHSPKTKTAGQTARAKAALAALQARSDSISEKSKTKVKVEMERIAAPTRASLLRDVKPPATKDCPRFTHHLSHDGTPSYLIQKPIERKTFLTEEEEYDLLRRLYTCPKINVYPRKLYEDMPPLKFWDSPASVIECYLQRKVFQQQLQKAYEFNQDKDIYEDTDTQIYSVNESQNRLVKAIHQLSEDMNYFSLINNESELKEAIENDLNQRSNLNEEIWDYIHPEVVVTLTEEKEIPTDRPLAEKSNIYAKFCEDIKNKFESYKRFYKLQNIKHEYNSPPLDPELLHLIPYNEESWDSLQSKFYKDSGEFSYDNSEYFDAKHSFTKLPNIKLEPAYITDKLEKSGVSNDSHCFNTHTCPLPPLPITTRDPRSSKTARDSLELAHKRLSPPSKTSFSKNINDLKQPKDSLLLLANKLGHKPSTGSDNEQNSIDTLKSMAGDRRGSQRNTLVDHKDSFLLTVERFMDKDKVGTLERFIDKDKVGESISCDLCNDRQFKSVQFLCDNHANQMNVTLQQSMGGLVSIISKTHLPHKDSVEISRRKKSSGLKDTKKSIACQVGEEYCHSQSVSEKLKDSGLKGSKKIKKSDDPSKVENIRSTSSKLKNTPSKLKNYLMNAVQINQIVTNESYHET